MKVKLLKKLMLASVASIALVSSGKAEQIEPHNLANGLGIMVNIAGYCKTTVVDSLNSRFEEYLTKAKAKEKELEAADPSVKQSFKEGFDENEGKMNMMRLGTSVESKFEFCNKEADILDMMFSAIENG